MIPRNDPRFDEVKTFFGAHPGIGGAGIRLPAEYKQAAAELEGQTMTVRRAIEKIESASEMDDEVEVLWHYGYFLLKLKRPSGHEHWWRLINYK